MINKFNKQLLNPDQKNRQRRNFSSLFFAAISVIGALLFAQSSVAYTVPTPTITAPPAGTHGFPFQSLVENPSDYGYVESEVFIEGNAVSYQPIAPLDTIKNGRWDATPTGPVAHYKTRLLVRRPMDAKKFNGTVLVEWMNVTSGYDIDSFGGLREELVREGYAWVGVSAQAVGVNYLLNWEAGPSARYISLLHPGDSYSYDIFSQAAQAVLRPNSAGPAPLGNLTRAIKKMIASGASQSGIRLFTYVNSVQPTTSKFNGFIILLAGQGAPLSQAPLTDVVPPKEAAAVIRSDSNAAVLAILTETEFTNFLGGPRGIHRQPDSQRFRLWEFPGASHAFKQGIEASAPKNAKSGIPVISLDCGSPPINDLDSRVVGRAALNAIQQWITYGAPPRSAPRAQLTVSDDLSQPIVIQRDPATGIALGGIRLPDVAAPIRTITGARPPAALANAPFCFLFGASDPWNHDANTYDGSAVDPSPTAEPNLVDLYGNKTKYVFAVSASAVQLVFQGYLRPYDAVEIIKKAQAVQIQ